jgi:hypothetical protein
LNHLTQFDIPSITPEQSAVLVNQGLPEGTVPSSSIEQLINEAYSEFEQLCKPVDSPIYQIYPRARHMTLFVLTMGSEVSERITELFKVTDYALGAMLDSVVSMAADKAAGVVEDQVGQAYCGKSDAALAYSPGYCGWHISGQRMLFDYLKPAEIGVTLNSSFLMSPIKSVSGVVIAGPAPIHKFVPKFNFCRECRTKSCVERIAELQLF